ncbi:hypothetical protein CWS35_24715 [Bradyrhizobium sp. SK17]|nr:hypothetical protein CWS35_24715 [Bradyrhizobium sp. SK17]
MDEVANAISDISQAYVREIGQRTGSAFSAILFGFCPRTGQALAFEIRFRPDGSRIELELEKHVLNNEVVLIIGNKPEILRKEIDQIRSSAAAETDLHGIIYADAPIRALQSVIGQQAIPSVGGSIQQAWSRPGKLEIVATATPLVPQPSSTRNAGMFVLGFDIYDMRPIGDYEVILMGRA